MLKMPDGNPEHLLNSSDTSLVDKGQAEVKRYKTTLKAPVYKYEKVIVECVWKIGPSFGLGRRRARALARVIS